ADEPEEGKDPLDVASDASVLPAATDLIAATLVPPPTALPVAEQLVARTPSRTSEEGQYLVELDLDRGAPAGGEKNAPALQAAAIAGQTGTAETVDGKKMPESSPLTDLLPDAGQQAAQTIQHTDFRAHLTAAQRPATELAVATPITHPGWADDVGHQVTWLADQGSSSAELVLTPPHLGRIEISLQIGPDQSSAQFVSASPQVREALEQAMPRLREMLASGGISLGEANVSSDHPSGERGHGNGRDGRGRDGSAAVEGLLATPARRGVGLVDLFA
ncbi:MAG TPA: flagellar hook-length control protein FliK, partial [Methyloversatilis sp.]